MPIKFFSFFLLCLFLSYHSSSFIFNPTRFDCFLWVCSRIVCSDINCAFSNDSELHNFCKLLDISFNNNGENRVYKQYTKISLANSTTLDYMMFWVLPISGDLCSPRCHCLPSLSNICLPCHIIEDIAMHSNIFIGVTSVLSRLGSFTIFLLLTDSSHETHFATRQSMEPENFLEKKSNFFLHGFSR